MKTFPTFPGFPPIPAPSFSNLLLVYALSAFGLHGVINAENATWAGDANTENARWNDTANWQSGAIPGRTDGTGNSDTAVFGTAGSNREITVDTGRLIQAVRIEAEDYTFSGASLRIADGGGIYLSDGTTAIFNPPVIIQPEAPNSDASIEIGGDGSRLVFKDGLQGGPTSETVSVNVRGGHGTTITGPITDGDANALRLIIETSHIITLDGPNTYSGGTRVDGSVTVSDASAFGTGTIHWTKGRFRTTGALKTMTFANDFALNGEFYSAADHVTFNGDIVLGTVEGAEPKLSSGEITINGVISDGPHAAPLAGTTARLNGDNTFTTGFEMPGLRQVVALGHNNALGTGTIFVPESGGHFAGNAEGTRVRDLPNGIRLDGRLHFNNTTYTVLGDVTVGSTDTAEPALTSNSDTATVFHGAFTDAGHNRPLAINATDRNDGTFILTGNSQLTGPLSVGAGILQIGDRGPTGRIGPAEVQLAENTELRFDRTGSYAVENSITGSGDVTYLGSGIITTTGDSTYTGRTTVGEGSTLRVNGSHSGGGGYTVAGGAMFGGTGSLELGDSKIVLARDARLSPGGAEGPGVLELSGGTLDLREQSGTGTGPLVFRLGSTSDRVDMHSSLLIFGHGLNFEDFTFVTGPNFRAGEYTLFDSRLLIADLGLNPTGTIKGMEAELVIEGNAVKLRVGQR